MAITWEEETTTTGSGTAKRNGAPSGLRDAGSNDKSDDEAGVGDGIVGGKAAGATNAGGSVAVHDAPLGGERLLEGRDVHAIGLLAERTCNFLVDASDKRCLVACPFNAESIALRTESGDKHA